VRTRFSGRVRSGDGRPCDAVIVGKIMKRVKIVDANFMDSNPLTKGEDILGKMGYRPLP
jgi:hypothetical protein